MVFKATGPGEITKGECRQRREPVARLPVDPSAEDMGSEGFGGSALVAKHCEGIERY